MHIPYNTIKKYKTSNKLIGQCLVINPLCLRPEVRTISHSLVKVSYIEDDGTVWCNYLDPALEDEFYGSFINHYFIGTIDESVALNLIKKHGMENVK